MLQTTPLPGTAFSAAPPPELLAALTDAAPLGLVLVRSVRNAQGQIIDFEYRWLNAHSQQLAGANIVGQRMLELYPHVQAIGLFDDFVAGVEHGQAVDVEENYAVAGRWFRWQASRYEDGLLIAVEEITAGKLAQQEALRQESQQPRNQYRALFNTMEEGFAVCEVVRNEAGAVTDWRFLEVNPATEKHAGIRPEQVLGRLCGEVLPGLSAEWFEQVARVVDTQQAEHIEQYDNVSDRWHELTMFPFGPERFAVLYHDITERRRNEARQAFRLGLRVALSTVVRPVEVEDAVTHAARLHFEADRCYYCEIEGPEAIIRRDASGPGLPSVAGVYPLEQFTVLKAVIEAGRPFIVPDVRTTNTVDEELRQICLALQVISYLNVPVVRAGQAVGVLCLVQSTPREWTTAEVELAQETAELTWTAVERAKAEATLLESEERQRFLLQLSDALKPLASPDAIANCVCQLLVSHLQASRAQYTQVEGEPGDEFGVVSGEFIQTGQPMPRRHRFADYGESVVAVLRAGKSLVITDVAQDARLTAAQRAAHVAVESSAAIAIPLLKEGRLSAVFTVHHDAARPWTPAEVTTVEEVAERTWAAVERAKAETALRASEEKYRTLFNSIDEGYCIIQVLFDATDQPYDWRFLEVNPAFEQNNGLHNAAGKTILELTPDIEPKWFMHYGQVARTGKPIRFEEHSSALGRWFSLYAFRVGAPGDNRVAVIFTDISLRKQTEQSLLESEDRFRNLVEANAQAVWETSADGLIEQDSPSWRAYTGQTLAEFMGHGWITAVHPDDRARVMQYWRQAVAAGHNANTEFRMRHALTGYRWTHVLATPIRDAAGHIRRWAGMNIDIDDRKQAEQALRTSEQQLRIALDAAKLGTWDWDLPTNTIRWNARHYEQLGLEPSSELRRPEDFLQYIHPDHQADVQQRLQAAVEVPQLFEAEFRIVTAQGEERWMSGHGQATASAPDGRTLRMSGVMLDITEQKQVEQQLQDLAKALERKVERRTQALQQSRDLLQSVYDTSLVGMSVLHAVCNEAGTIQDFTFVSVNQELTRIMGRPNVAGRRYLEVFPELRGSALLEAMQRTVDTGVPEQLEYLYPGGPTPLWLACMYVRLDDGLVATVLDVTARKLAEEERQKHLALLLQAEDVAGLGSWEYNPATDTFTWSAGMYQLFSRPPHSAVPPAVYLEHVLTDDHAVAERLTEQLRAGTTHVEETLRIRAGSAVKTLRVKAIRQPSVASLPGLLLGVDLDISQVRQLEEDNLQLRLAQQRALFEAVQQTQEAERQRIAEALHNGVGQLLYAIKLRLSQVQSSPNQLAPVAYTEASRLITEAIAQTRALSHELVPLVLKEFGLEAALQDICRKLSSRQMYIRCHVQLDDPRPTPALQLALYRMAQELCQNVVKHAPTATEAYLEVETMPGFVLLRVEDNGPGFPDNPGGIPGSGLGLRTIRDRVALLGGTLETGNSPEFGAYVRIRIPLISSHL
ncbi:PAS domain S-box protein [Hymenobacter pini]|uniref:PAS domain S-box protein n=1 Tax=Hymenobacter pini TaxID=2880879 RepID=UPI001CF4A240|nr:PAS domain S-box protein [Hymenobacter pini]MCA8830464.1 PAS domain S-box protein [Hymenobacter pini]